MSSRLLVASVPPGAPVVVLDGVLLREAVEADLEAVADAYWRSWDGQEARSPGPRIALRVEDDAGPARALYAALGFREVA